MHLVSMGVTAGALAQDEVSELLGRLDEAGARDRQQSQLIRELEAERQHSASLADLERMLQEALVDKAALYQELADVRPDGTRPSPSMLCAVCGLPTLALAWVVLVLVLHSLTLLLLLSLLLKNYSWYTRTTRCRLAPPSRRCPFSDGMTTSPAALSLLAASVSTRPSPACGPSRWCCAMRCASARCGARRSRSPGCGDTPTNKESRCVGA